MRKIFIQECEKLGIELTDTMLEQFDLYLKLLLEANERMNLTAIKDEDEIWIKHFLDSLSIYPYVKDAEELMDVGTGAGFPGIPLKIVLPNLKLRLVDATAKKCAYLADTKSKLGLKGVQIINGRAEEIAHKGVRSKVVAARAVGDLAILSELCIPLVKMKGYFIAMKGPNGDSELANASNALSTLGGKLIKRDEYTLPENQVRINLIIQKYKPTEGKYPRRYAEIKKKPL